MKKIIFIVLLLVSSYTFSQNTCVHNSKLKNDYYIENKYLEEGIQPCNLLIKVDIISNTKEEIVFKTYEEYDEKSYLKDVQCNILAKDYDDNSFKIKKLIGISNESGELKINKMDIQKKKFISISLLGSVPIILETSKLLTCLNR